MKKTLSLLMSILLILTMTFSLAAQASAIQIKPVTLCVDMKNAQTVTIPYDNATTSYYLAVDDILTLKLTSTSSRTIEILDDGTKAMKISRSSGSDKYIYFTYSPRNESGESFKPTDGKFVFETRFLSTDTLGASRRCFRAIWTGGSSAGVATNIYDAADESKWLKNTWYDIVWTIDLDTNSITLVSTPELSAASSAEVADYTLTKSNKYDKADLTSIRADFQTTNASGHYTYFSDIRITYHPSTTYNKAEITSIGSDGEIAFDQNNVSFALSDEIPNLSKEHISIQNAGGQDVAISSAAIINDGANPVVNITTQNPLPAWTQYTLTISPDAWGKASVQIEDDLESAVTAISADFHTPSAPFDMKEPVFEISNGKLTVDTTLINTSGTAEDVTLVIAVYDSDGRIKSVNPTTYENLEAAYPGADKHIEASFSEGESAKVFVVNGWTNRTPLFGKYWTISYDDLNS